MYLLVFYAHINEMHSSRSKIPSKKTLSGSAAQRDLIPVLKGQSTISQIYADQKPHFSQEKHEKLMSCNRCTENQEPHCIHAFFVWQNSSHFGTSHEKLINIQCKPQPILLVPSTQATYFEF
jgi:hypothetical protein